MNTDNGDREMINEIEVLGIDGKTWYLWLNNVMADKLGIEVFRALQTYDKVRVNGGKVYQVA